MHSYQSSQILKFLEEDYWRVRKDYGVTRDEYNEMLAKAWEKFNDPMFVTVSPQNELKDFYKPYHDAWVDRHNQKLIEASYDYQI